MRLFSLTRLCLSAALCGCVFAPKIARADAFSPIPAGNPIYRQLDALSMLGDGKDPKPANNLTRYEAALQVARVAVVVTSKPDALTRTGWRALRELTQSLKTELRQLGVDVEEVLTACSHQLEAPSKPLLPAPAPVQPRPSKSGGPNAAPSMPSLLGSATSPARLGTTRRAVGSDLELPLFGKTRVDAVVSALERDANDPLFTKTGALGKQSISQFASQDVALNMGVTPWLNLRALSSQRQLGLGTDAPPALSAPIFAGANSASSFGGGVEVSPLNGLKFGANIEQLSTNTGARGTRAGVGIGFSAWQNKLTMSAYMARLQPEDRAMLATNETDVRLGLGVTQRLSLNLLYQGLFSSQSESSRLAGGLNFSF